MGADQHFDWLASAASALDWWRDAGVDVLVDEAPRDWFATATPPRTDAAPGTAVSQAATPVASGAELPDDLEAFVAWRTSAAAPEATWRGAAVTASGPADAAVMILVDCPDADDCAPDGSGGLLTAGPAGTLFRNMLAAIGLDRDRVHLTAVCAKRPLAGRMPRETEALLGEIARHHVALAAPKRLLALGNAASRAILATDVQPARGSLHGFNHRIGQTGLVASFHPRFLLERPALKAEAWRDLQLLMKGL